MIRKQRLRYIWQVLTHRWWILGKHRSSEENENDELGISLNFDSDSLEEEIEEIYFNAEEWGEEGMDVDL